MGKDRALSAERKRQRTEQQDMRDPPASFGVDGESRDMAYVESMKVLNAITSSEEGTVTAILVNHGDDIEEDTPLISLS